MAWKKINMNEAENYYCDISNEDIHNAISELKYKFKEAGITLPNNDVYSNPIRGRLISKRSISSKLSSKEKSSRKRKIIASANRRKRGNVLIPEEAGGQRIKR